MHPKPRVAIGNFASHGAFYMLTIALISGVADCKDIRGQHARRHH